MGGTHAEVGLKPHLSLKGHVTKEEELKSHLVAVQTTKLHFLWQLLKFKACKTSERTRASVAGMGLALVAVDLGGIYTQGLGQARVSAATMASTAGAGSWLSQALELTSLHLCQWPGENSASESPGPIAIIPTIKVGPRPVSTTVYVVNLHNEWKRIKESTLTDEQLQKSSTQWLLSQWECSNTAYLTLQITDTAKKHIWRPLLQQLGSRPHPWQGSDNHRARGDPTQYWGQTLVTKTPNPLSSG